MKALLGLATVICFNLCVENPASAQPAAAGIIGAPGLSPGAPPPPAATGNVLRPGQPLDPNTGLPLPPAALAGGSVFRAGAPIDPTTGLPFLEVKLPPPADSRRLKELNIDAWPLQEFVKLLRKEFPEVNFIIPNKVLESIGEGYTVSFQVRNVGLIDCLNALGYSTDGELSWYFVPDNLVVFQSSRNAPDREGRNLAPPANRTVNVMNVSAALRSEDTQQVKKTLETARELTIATLRRLYDEFDEGRHMTDSNYHPGTGVLVLVGPDYANKVFMDILRNISQRRVESGGASRGQGQAQPEPAAQPEKPAAAK